MSFDRCDVTRRLLDASGSSDAVAGFDLLCEALESRFGVEGRFWLAGEVWREVRRGGPLRVWGRTDLIAAVERAVHHLFEAFSG